VRGSGVTREKFYRLSRKKERNNWSIKKMLRVSVYLALVALCSHKASTSDAQIMDDKKRANVIIMHVNNLVRISSTQRREL
jgi:hypothetical protein